MAGVRRRRSSARSQSVSASDRSSPVAPALRAAWSPLHGAASSVARIHDPVRLSVTAGHGPFPSFREHERWRSSLPGRLRPGHGTAHDGAEIVASPRRSSDDKGPGALDPRFAGPAPDHGRGVGRGRAGRGNPRSAPGETNRGAPWGAPRSFNVGEDDRLCREGRNRYGLGRDRRKARGEGPGGWVWRAFGWSRSGSSLPRCCRSNLFASVHLLAQKRRNIEVVAERPVVRQAVVRNIEGERGVGAPPHERAL